MAFDLGRAPAQLLVLPRAPSWQASRGASRSAFQPTFGAVQHAPRLNASVAVAVGAAVASVAVRKNKRLRVRRAAPRPVSTLRDSEVQASLQLPAEHLRIVQPDIRGRLSEWTRASLEGDWMPLFRGSAPYIAMFRQSVMVFHVPGWLFDRRCRKDLEDLMGDVALCALLGVRPVLVLSLEHQLTARLRADGLEPEWSASGRLVVRSEAVELLKQEAGVVTAEVELLLNRPRQQRAPSFHARNIGQDFSVYSSSQLFQPVVAKGGDGGDILGAVQIIDTDRIQRRLEDGDIVCMTQLGIGSSGEVLYVPSDQLAMEVSKGLQAAKLIFFTRGQRIVDSRQDNVVATMQLNDARAFVELARGEAGSSSFSDSPGHRDASEVVGYLDIIANALSHGTRRGHLIDPRQGALLQELFTTDGSGTMISHDLYEGIGFAKDSDVAGILALIRPLTERGLLKQRTALDIENACNDREMFVWRRDGDVIACAQLCRFPDSQEQAELGCFVVSPHSSGQGLGAILFSYVERLALLYGYRTLFLLTTRAMQWFVERGFREGCLDDLPPSKRSAYDQGRSSRIYVKDVTTLPREVLERLAFVEVDALGVR